MTKTKATKEIERLKDSIHQLREQINRLIRAGEGYTDDIDCVFCSGLEGYESSNESDSGEIVHAPECEAVKANKLVLSRLS